MQSVPVSAIQLRRLNRLLQEVWERNPFYTHKWRRAGVKRHALESLEQLAAFPFTTRAELVADQKARPPLGTNLTGPAKDFERIHSSSGTTRAPILWADTGPSWEWVIHCSRDLFRLAGVSPADRLFFAMPFRRSSGPWIMYGGARSMGCACFTAWNSSFEEQIASIQQAHPTVLVAKPLELRRLAHAAAKTGVDTLGLGLTRLISPGCGLDETRESLVQLWGAACFDRYGLTEAGSVAGECAAHPGGMHLLEQEFIAEIIRPDTAQPVPDGKPGELVLTNLGRLARPIVRYRTGDLVRLLRHHQCPCGRPDAIILGGVRRMSLE